jgi:thermostable 8-oxoguanine DNA glycosylase
MSTGYEDLERELLFCLLGGFGITYEHDRSATEIVATLAPFADFWNDGELLDALVATLSQAQFEPARRDGSPRRYRYPMRKARLIVDARRWVLQHGPLAIRLAELPDCRSRREFLCDCPGFGLKSASWLLRNVGLGSQLAIIDIHILRALADVGRVPRDVRLPRDYEAAEKAFLDWCIELAAPPPAFDLFLWAWQRQTATRI